MDIISHLNPRYPATYISDGNQADTFPDHAKAMARAMRETGIEHVFNDYEESEARLSHSHAGELDTKFGRDNFAKAVTFIRSRTGTAEIRP